MKLPKKIQIAGLVITINQVEGLVKKREIIGSADYPNLLINIDPTAAPHDWTMQAYYHEKIHWILHIMSEHELCNNEKFVDMFAHLLYQSDKTEEYD